MLSIKERETWSLERKVHLKEEGAASRLLKHCKKDCEWDNEKPTSRVANELFSVTFFLNENSKGAGL